MRVLAFSRTLGYRHDSIPAAAAALAELSAAQGWSFSHSEDSGCFDAVELSRRDVVVLLNNTGDCLGESERADFEAFVRKGGGVVAMHAASVVDFDWPFYEELVGARFAGHPEVQRGILRREDAEHPATRALPAAWEWTEEWYDFCSNPRGRVRVLASVDESSYHGGKMQDHPLIWCHERLGGRVLYTGLGHASAAYADPTFLTHLSGAIRWASGADCAPGAAP